jgi:DNA-binding GntR family transcriptional regulator
LENEVTYFDPFDSAKSTADCAYRKLEHMVVTLELTPGSTTTESELRQRVGLGRTPVREAVQRLAWEGLLEILPRAGVKVPPIDRRDWLRIMEVRRSVEVTVARSAARHATSQAKALLELAGEELKAAAASQDLDAYMAADKKFDIAMAEAAGNCHLARAAFPLQSHTRRFWMQFHRDDSLEGALHSHMHLARAVIDGDAARSVRAARNIMSLVQVSANRTAGS